MKHLIAEKQQTYPEMQCSVSNLSTEHLFLNN